MRVQVCTKFVFYKGKRVPRGKIIENYPGKKCPKWGMELAPKKVDETDAPVKKSKDLTIREAKPFIEAMNREQLGIFVDGDEREGIKDLVVKRVAELEATPQTTLSQMQGDKTISGGGE